MELHILKAGTETEIDSAFAALAQLRAGGLVAASLHEMARCAVSESCAVVDTKGEYRRAHRDSVERVIIFDASARISG